jgi:hypothetical protein
VDRAGGIARTPSAPLQRLEFAEGSKRPGAVRPLDAGAAPSLNFGLNGAIAEPFAAPVTVVLQSRS